MRIFSVVLGAALSGALLAVALVYALASSGLMPINDRQMQTYLMLHPELAQAMMGRQQQIEDARTKQIQDAAMKTIDPSAFFDPKLAFLFGPPDAKKTLVEFYDYDCPFCRASLPAVMKYVAAHHNDTRFSFFEFPLASLHGPGAVLAARASLAARLQPDHFLPFHFALLSEQAQLDDGIIFADAAKAGLDVAKLKADMQRPEIDQEMAASLALTKKAHIVATPTFLFNGVLHEGAVDEDELAQLMKGGAG
jgi:protein-disulfide isomerase